MTRRIDLGWTIGLGLLVAVAATGFGQEPGATAAERRVLLRMASDSAVVGHYRFTVQVKQRLAFDIAADDPRAELLATATVPKQRTTDVAATIVSTPRADDEDRRYIAYWMGYRVHGDDVQGLTSFQWDTVFQMTGRQASVTFSPRGHPRGVSVNSDATRPVGESLAEALLALALALPEDSVAIGALWEDNVAVTLQAPDGSEWLTPVAVTYRLRDLEPGAEGTTIARIEFDGEPLERPNSATKPYGRYFGESRFSVE
ncbi:MAG: hypothetical protein AMS21_06200, partial [Gemmatimonas sp. SG8_38_2]